MSAVTVLPPTPSRNRLSLSSFLSAMTPNILYFSLYLVPECDVSYIPAPVPATLIHPALTHLSIINFRVPPSFIALFPLLVEATITLLVTPPQSDLAQLQYRPKDVQAILLSLPPCLKRLTITCTNLPVDLITLAAQRFLKLTHLSFVWIDAPDRISGGVESTDITHTLRQYAEAIAPLANTLQALYLPACVGQPTSKYPASTLSPDDELLGEGPVLFPALDPIDGGGMGTVGFGGLDQPLKHGRISVGMKALLDACRTLVKGVGGVRTAGGQVVGTKGMWELMKIGWLIPQGEGMPLLPIECVRRRGVVKFGATPQSPSSLPISIVNGVKSISISSAPRDTSYSIPSPFKLSTATSSLQSSPTSPFQSTTYTPNIYAPRSVPITFSTNSNLISPVSPVSQRASNYYPTPGFQTNHMVQSSLVESSTPGYREEDEYWYPNMEWSDDCAWPAFAEIETVFPRPACMRY